MRIIDLTQLISPDMPVYPGTEPPKLDPANTYEANGFRETLLTLFSHTGTHMDAPAHLFPGRTTLDAFPASQFVGKALVLDCTDLPEGSVIGMERVDAVRQLADRADFLLIRTGWDARWGTEAYFGDYPVISPEVAAYLTASGKKGIGLDVIGVDPIADENLTLHKQLFAQHEIVVIENLCRLDQCGRGLFTFCALPLKFDNADGAPVRAVALLDQQ